MLKMPTIVQNWAGVWHRYRWWIVGFTIAVLFDAFSTMSFMLADSAAEE